MNLMLGRLPIRLATSHPVGRLIADELSSIQAHSGHPDRPLLTIDFSDDPAEVQGSLRTGPVSAGDGQFTYLHQAFSYVVTPTEEQLGITFHPGVAAPGASRYLTPSLRRFADWTYLTDDARLAKHFMYECFDYLSQVAQLRRGQTYVHASAVETGSGATLLAAWGGVGKTSSMLHLVQRHGLRFLADDLAVLDDNATVYRHPKKMQVYGYNLTDDRQLAATLHSGRRVADRIAWTTHHTVRGSSKVRRRLAAEELFVPEQIGTSAKLRQIIWLQRADVPSLTLEPTEVEDVAHRAAWTLIDELAPFSKVSSALAASGSSLLATPDELANMTEDALRRAFRSLPCHVILVPRGTSPAKLSTFLSDKAGVSDR